MAPNAKATERYANSRANKGRAAGNGSPNLVNFQVEHGVYIVPKVLDRGYLAIGKQRLPFEKVR